MLSKPTRRQNRTTFILFGLLSLSIAWGAYTLGALNNNKCSNATAVVSNVPTTIPITTTPCPTSTPPQTTANSDDEMCHAPPPPPKKKAQPFHLTVCVFTYNRLEGLRRIWKSLVDARYGDDVVTVKVLFDYKSGERDDTENWLNENVPKWPHGPYSVHKRETNVGLKHNIMEAFYPLPSDHNSVAAFFEDDIEVSPFWYEWTRVALLKYKVHWVQNTTTDSNNIHKFLGISLYRPIHDELTGHRMPMHTDHPTTPFLFQQPCSWGAVYFPSAWRHFRSYYSQTRNTNPIVDSVDVSSNSWDHKSSWKKYLIKHMVEKGSYMLYANFPQKTVLSTNHLMKGEHNLPPRKLFELPLFTEDVAREYRTSSGKPGYNPLEIPEFNALPIYNVVVERVKSVEELSRG